MSITDADSIVLLAASNLVTLRAPGQGVKEEDLVKATVVIYSMLKKEINKGQEE